MKLRWISPAFDYFQTSFGELKKVVWPTRKEIVRHTIVIVVSVLITIILVGLLDVGLTSLVRTLILGEVPGGATPTPITKTVPIQK